jgi:predicted nucleic acid-binding Zn ribbon protein
MAERPGKPAPVGEAVASFLKQSGLDAVVQRASVLADWPAIVGPQIARVTTPQRVTRDGTLYVDVASHQWMSELSLMEVQLLEKINAREGGEPIRRIRWGLRR